MRTSHRIALPGRSDTTGPPAVLIQSPLFICTYFIATVPTAHNWWLIPGIKCANKGWPHTPDQRIVCVLTQNCTCDFQDTETDAVLVSLFQLSAHPSRRSLYENEPKALTAVNLNTKFLSAAFVLAHSFQLAFSHRSHYRNNKKNQNLSHMNKMVNDGNTLIKVESLSLTGLSAFELYMLLAGHIMGVNKVILFKFI